MGVVFTNNAETTLAAAITSTSATSISVTSSSTFPTVGAGEYFYATISDGSNLEIVKVTAVSGTTWTVVRASDDTTARTFANGSTVQLRTTAALLTDIQENIASKSANQTVYNATAASSATAYDVGINPGVEANAMVFLDGVMQHHDTFSFSGSTLTFDAAPVNGTKIEVIVDNLINLQSSNLTVDTFTATSNQTAFTLSDSPAAESNLIVFINGVFQNQAAYTISNNTLTLDTGVVSGRTVTVYVINPVNIGTPSDGTVTSAKLSGNITTPGTLTVGSHDVAFDSPTFVVDNSNSRVGLGTASPSVPVDIVGDVKMSANLTVDTSTLVVDSSNNKVGIGTTSPSTDLHISGTNSDTNGQLKVTATGSGADSQIVMSTPTNARGMYVDDDDTNKLKFYSGFGKGASGKEITFDNNANVGIGETAPAGKLHIKGTDVSASPVSTANQLVLEDTENGISILSSTAGSGNIVFGDSGDNFKGGFIYDHSTDAMRHFANGGEKMRILANGNVGIGGNATPLQALEVYRNSSSGSQGGYAGLSLRNDHSSGYMACQFHEGSTLRGDILFQNGVDAMQFRVGGGGTERMRITDAGTLLISTNAASGLSNSNSNFGHSFGGGQQVNSTNNDLCLILNRSLGSGDMVAIRNNGSTIGSISQNGSNVTYGGTSDYRLKENVTDMTNATTRLKQLKPKRFNYISDASNTLVDGFLAHEVSSVVPESVVGSKDAVDSNNDPVWQMMDNSKLVPLLVKTIQELEARITELEK